MGRNNGSSFKSGPMNPSMASATEAHPIASIQRIIRTISIYMMDFYFSFFDSAFLTPYSKNFYTFFNPNSFGRFITPILTQVITPFRTIFSSTSIFIGFAFKRFHATSAFYSGPFFKASLDPRVPMIVASKKLRIIPCVRPVVTKFSAKFILFCQRWVKKIFFFTQLTDTLNFRHKGILTG